MPLWTRPVTKASRVRGTHSHTNGRSCLGHGRILESSGQQQLTQVTFLSLVELGPRDTMKSRRWGNSDKFPGPQGPGEQTELRAG